MRFKIDWASLIVGRKFTVFALFYFVFEGNFQVQALYMESLFSEFYGIQHELQYCITLEMKKQCNFLNQSYMRQLLRSTNNILFTST